MSLNDLLPPPKADGTDAQHPGRALTPAGNRPGPWKPGESGNPKGRPPGARGKLQEKFLLALHDDFAKNGQTAVQAARLKDPVGYLKIIRSLFPSNLKVDATEEVKRFMNLVAEGGYNITDGPNGPQIELEATDIEELLG